MTDRLVTALLDEIAADPAALERLRELVGHDSRQDLAPNPAPAYTPRTLALELGRSELIDPGGDRSWGASGGQARTRLDHLR